MSPLIGTTISGVDVLQHRFHRDERGSFGRIFDSLWLSVEKFVVKQVNLSSSRARGTLRGMHYQSAEAQEAKVITCLSGKVFDVVVDLRRNSATYLKWAAIELEAGDGMGLLIPRGCAHGFLTLEPDVQLLYLHDNIHDPRHEGGINFADPTLNILWPDQIKVISERDSMLPLISDDFAGL